MTLKAIPKLVDVVADPEKIRDVPQEAIPELVGELERLKTIFLVRLMRTPVGPSTFTGQPELIDSVELGKRWNVPESWVRDGVRKRSGDPIPCVRLGRYVKFQWGAPELAAWFERRKSGANFKQEGRAKNHLTKHPIPVYQ